jgi:hypothetical protein
VKYCLVLLLVPYGAGLAQMCAPTSVLPPNARVSAGLDTSDCTLSDGTSFTDYLVTFPSRGNWSASVTAADGTALTVTLRDPSGAKLASGASVQRMVERGTYHVLVNAAAPSQTVGYQLTSSFTAAPRVLCQQFPLMGTLRTISGLLGPGSCLLPDGSAYDAYLLTLYGTGTVDIAITPTGFAPLLILRTSDGFALPGVTSVDANGLTHLTVNEVGSDTYTLIVAVSSPDQTGGTYAVSAGFTPDPSETCLSLATLTESQQTSGSISTASCNFNLPGRQDYAPFNYYNLHLDQTGVIQASIDTSDFSPLLLLLDADGNTINEDIESGGNGIPLIRQQLPPGDYQLVIFNEDSFGGNYTLSYQYTSGPAAPCPVTLINPGDQPSGILAGGSSCKDSIFMSDAYQVVLPADGTLNLTLSSPDFSPFLDLHDAKDNGLTWGTQSADGSTSSFAADLPAGTYYVYAASMDLPGGYALSYTFTPATLAPCPAATKMPPNGFIHNAQLGSTSCEGTDGRRSDFYQFTLPAASTQAVFMTSGSLSPDVTLYQSDGTPLRNDQNSYFDDNAVVVQYLPAGSYTIRARSADPTSFGPYNLDLYFQQGAPPQLCAPYNLPQNGSVSGQTSYTSCAWYDKTFADVYQLNVTSSSQLLTIAAQSIAFDAFLELMDAKGNILAVDDNSGGGLNPLIAQVLDPGTYFVVVKPAQDSTSAGSYSLTTTVSAAPVN